jgi:hypothetical protein
MRAHRNIVEPIPIHSVQAAVEVTENTQEALLLRRVEQT